MTRRATKGTVVARVLASMLGGWLFVFGQTALGVAVATVVFGMSFEDAQSLFALLAFPVFVALVCWSFIARSTKAVWAVLVGSGLLMTGAGWLLGR